MKARLTYLAHSLGESFWFIPAVMTLAAAGLSVITFYVDTERPFLLLEVLPWSYGSGLTNARLIMSTIAGSTITAASLVFSMTLVSLTLAAGQLGPRLLSLFMRDRMTQVVLGTFVATFVFALLVLATLGERADSTSTPKVAVLTALLLTIVCFALLIVFIHHLAASLHADAIVARMAENLDRQLVELLRDGGRQAASVEDASPSWCAQAEVAAASEGYVQTIDTGALTEITRENDTEMIIRRRPGHFVCRGEVIAELRNDCADMAGVSERVNGAIVFGPKRTNTNDPEFALQAIVEIALKALSPGINDPYTALTCIDWIGQALARIMTGTLPGPVIRDKDNTPRLHVDCLTLAGLFGSAFNEIRQAAGGNVSVLVRMAETLKKLAWLATTEEQGELIRRHAAMVRRQCERCVDEANDQKDAMDELDAVDQALAASSG